MAVLLRVHKNGVLAFVIWQTLAARAVDERCAIPDISPLITSIIENNLYSRRWIERDQQNFTDLFKLEKVAKASKKDGDNVYKDRYVIPQPGGFIWRTEVSITLEDFIIRWH